MHDWVKKKKKKKKKAHLSVAPALGHLHIQVHDGRLGENGADGSEGFSSDDLDLDERVGGLDAGNLAVEELLIPGLAHLLRGGKVDPELEADGATLDRGHF
jgi:hypothetical protein